MTAKPPLPSREDRLAAKLRENLRRRKAQARELGQGEQEQGEQEQGEQEQGEQEQAGPELPPIAALPKGDPSS